MTVPSASPDDVRPAVPVAAASVSSQDMSFEAVVAQYLPVMLRIARRMMGSEDLAWDATQESLLSLWRASVRPPEPRPWLARTVRNRCLHLKRTMRRRCYYEAQARAAARSAIHPRRPDHCLENHRLLTELERALGTLPPAQRAVLVLREMHGLDDSAIARQLGLALGTVRSRLHRARAGHASGTRRWRGPDGPLRCF